MGNYTVVVSNAFGTVTSGVATLSVTDSRIIGWGANPKGQINVPQWLKGVVNVAAGDAFGLTLTRNGEVMGWGTILEDKRIAQPA